MVNTHTQPDMHAEMETRDADLLPSIVLNATGLTVPAPPSLTLAPFGAVGYVFTGAPQHLCFVSQPVRAIPLSGSDGTYWLALHHDVSTAVASWTRVPGSHYLWRSSGTYPGEPPGGLVFAHCTVVGGVITAVTLEGAVTGAPMSRQNSNAVVIGGGTLAGVRIGAMGLADPLYSLRSYGNTYLDGNLTTFGSSHLSGPIGAGGVPDALYSLRSYGNTYLDGNLTTFGNSLLSGRVGIQGAVDAAYGLRVYSNAGIPGGAWVNTTSRAALKRAIRPLEDATALLKQLQPRQWEWARPEEETVQPGTQAGFVVEEVQAVQPAWTPQTPDGQPGLAMRGLDAYVVAVLQEVLARLDALEARQTISER